MRDRLTDTWEDQLNKRIKEREVLNEEFTMYDVYMDIIMGTTSSNKEVDNKLLSLKNNENVIL